MSNTSSVIMSSCSSSLSDISLSASSKSRRSSGTSSCSSNAKDLNADSSDQFILPDGRHEFSWLYELARSGVLEECPQYVDLGRYPDEKGLFAAKVLVTPTATAAKAITGLGVGAGKKIAKKQAAMDAVLGLQRGRQ